MSKADVLQCRVMEAFLPLIFNDDPSGLTATEIKEFRDYEREISEMYGAGHWSMPADAEPHFALCEVTGVRGQVIDIEYVFWRD